LSRYGNHETAKRSFRLWNEAVTCPSTQIKVEAIPLSALPKDTASELAGLIPSHYLFFMLNFKLERCEHRRRQRGPCPSIFIHDRDIVDHYRRGEVGGSCLPPPGDILTPPGRLLPPLRLVSWAIFGTKNASNPAKTLFFYNYLVNVCLWDKRTFQIRRRPFF